MRFGGLQKTTLIDFPGKVAATVFTVGCPFRCSYCHNPELVLPDHFGLGISQDEVLDFLTKRSKQLEGLCISGGEPTIHKDLRQFILRVKQLGYLVKLDSNGINPDVLEKIFQDNSVDYIAMDIKAPIKRYSEIVRAESIEKQIQKSVQVVMNSGIEYEFRTTVAKPLLSVNDFEEIGSLIKGAKRHFLQNYVKAPKQVDQKKLLEPFTKAELDEAQVILQNYVDSAQIRC